MSDQQTTVPKDVSDFASLWQDPGLGDGITTGSFHFVPVGKPKDFFRTHPDQAYRRRTEIYVHKPEGAIDEQTYIVAPTMQGRITEAQPYDRHRDVSGWLGSVVAREVTERW